MLGQFSWASVGEISVVMVPLAGLPLTLMVFYLRALRGDFKQAVADSKEAVREVHKRIDRVDERLTTVEDRKVSRRDFVTWVARTNGKIDRLFTGLGDIKGLVHKLDGRLEGENGTGRQIAKVGARIATALEKEAAA